DQHEAEQRLDEVRVDHVRGHRQERTDGYPNRFSELDAEVRAQASQVLPPGDPPGLRHQGAASSGQGAADQAALYDQVGFEGSMRARELELRQPHGGSDPDDALDVVAVTGLVHSVTLTSRFGVTCCRQIRRSETR